MTDIERLYVSSIDTKPVNIDWHPDTIADEDGVTDNGYWETFEYQHADTDYTLLAHNGQVEGVVIDGTLFTDYQDYEEWWDEERESTAESTQEASMEEQFDKLHESDWNFLIGVEPYQYGSEGPMMNYWYPVDRIDDDDTAAACAVAINDLPLCVVQVGDDYGLALTGGGMDLSWHICKAFIALGCLPPVHFADLPNQGEWDEDVYRAMIRSLTTERDWMEQRITRLADLKVRVAERMK